MLHRRVLYSVALAAVLLFQILNDNYLAHFLLALCLALPLLSAALSAPALLSCRLSLSTGAPNIQRGEKAGWQVTVEGRSGLPIAGMTFRLVGESLFSGGRFRAGQTMTGMAEKNVVNAFQNTQRCGVWECRIVRARAYDYLGLFAFPIRLPEPVRVTVEPIPRIPGVLNLPEGAAGRPAAPGERYRNAGEDYELREYRPGDPLRAIHWKLSSKWDELIVRERAQTTVPPLLLTFDHFGRAEELEWALDRLSGLCRALLAVERPCVVAWLEADGEFRRYPVSDEGELRDCLSAVLSSAAPEEGPSILDRPELIAGIGPVYHLHVSGQREADGHD